MTEMGPFHTESMERLPDGTCFWNLATEHTEKVSRALCALLRGLCVKFPALPSHFPALGPQRDPALGPETLENQKTN
jgi:hypothetical protein